MGSPQRDMTGLPNPPRDAWYILDQAKKIRSRPVAVTFYDRPHALFKGQNGEIGTLLDRCPHRNVPLSDGKVEGGAIVCPYHGWRFSTDGRCVAIPGLDKPPAEKKGIHAQPLETITQDGFVWGWGGDRSPDHSPYQIPLISDPTYAHLVHTELMTGGICNILENFLDGLHTHYVHAGLIRTEGQRKLINVNVRAIPGGVEAIYADEGEQSGLISKIFGGGITHNIGRFIWPSIAQLEYCAGEETRMLITMAFTPERVNAESREKREERRLTSGVSLSPLAGERTRLFAVASGKVPFGLRQIAKWGIRPFLARALRQDQEILVKQQENLARFGRAQYVYTELDVMMPHIVRLLKHGPNALNPEFERHLTMWL
ncbi:MAG: aromatic ring-hydroxylating dioxygenase subunit alpha [Chloroflexota bacterium]